MLGFTAHTRTLNNVSASRCFDRAAAGWRWRGGHFNRADVTQKTAKANLTLRITALAEDYEVWVRKVYRDIDQLSAACMPV